MRLSLTSAVARPTPKVSDARALASAPASVVRRGRKGVNGAGGKFAAVFQGPAIGREFNFRSALDERRGKRRRGKEMTSRAPRREQNAARCAHSAGAT